MHVFGWATLLVMAVISWALFGILEIGHLIEEPFTASIGFDEKKLYVLPLTEVCRTIRRDVRAISFYARRGREFNVPTILRKPSASAVPPDSFSQIRQMAADAAAEAAAKEAADKEAAEAAARAGG